MVGRRRRLGTSNEEVVFGADDVGDGYDGSQAPKKVTETLLARQ